MPWWIWLMLALFMLTMIVIGCVFAVRRALAAMRTVRPTLDRFGRTMDRLADAGDPQDSRSEVFRPFFTQPLSVASDRYADQHARVIERGEAARERRMATWARWSHFNEQV